MALYTEKYLRAASEFNDKRLGVQFGKLCIQANLPPSMIAKALHVSRMSVYNWFKGNPLRGKNISKIERAIDIRKTFRASYFTRSNCSTSERIYL